MSNLKTDSPCPLQHFSGKRNPEAFFNLKNGVLTHQFNDNSVLPNQEPDSRLIPCFSSNQKFNLTANVFYDPENSPKIFKKSFFPTGLESTQMPFKYPYLDGQRTCEGTPNTNMSSNFNDYIKKVIPSKIEDLKLKKVFVPKKITKFGFKKTKNNSQNKNNLKDPFGSFVSIIPPCEQNFSPNFENLPKRELIIPCTQKELFSCDESFISKLENPLKLPGYSKIGKQNVKKFLKILRLEKKCSYKIYRNDKIRRNKILGAFQKSSTVMMNYEKLVKNNQTNVSSESFQDSVFLPQEFLLDSENWKNTNLGKRKVPFHPFFETVYIKWQNEKESFMTPFKKINGVKYNEKRGYAFREQNLSGKNVLRRTRTKVN